MKTLSGYFDAAYTAWLGTAVAVNCCSSPRKSGSEVDSSRNQIERPMRIEHQQPRLIPPPISEPPSRPGTSRGREWADRTRTFASRASSRGRFSARKRLNAYNGPRRPRIGAPSDFRHVGQAMPTRTAPTFRPLELSIYREERLSPLLPHFDTMEELPRPASALTHTRSESALSFRIPRKPLRASSRASSEWTSNFQARPGSISAQELLANIESELPRVPEQARLRSMTEPPAYERIKSALHEKFELEQRLRDIDEVIEERKSVYFNSRPTSRATSRGARSIYSDATKEPMPLTPITQPSFATRVAATSSSTITTTIIPRPQTAPAKPIHPLQISAISPTIPSPPPKSPLRPQAYALPPPLPLILVQNQKPSHPPLRKKKSFGRVSTWLFPNTSATKDDGHKRIDSMDSITNTPKPVTEKEGFYQCVEMPQVDESYYNRRDSVSSVSTLSTITTTYSEEFEERNENETITPESSPGRRIVGRGNLGFEKEMEVERLGVRRSRVGVAF